MARIEPRLFPIVERREVQYDASWQAASLGGSGSSILAENLSAVTGAVELITNSIASLPAYIMQTTPDGLVEAPSAAAMRVIARPNQYQSFPSFMTTMVSSLLLHGNFVAMIGYDARGALTSLTGIPWNWVSPQVVNGRLVFDVNASGPEAQLLGLPPRILAADAFHVKMRSEAGLIGRSVLSRSPSVLEAAHGVQEFSTAVWRNGANPSMVVAVPPGLDPQEKRRMVQMWESRTTGARNTGRILWADKDTTITPFTMNSTDAEVLASRRFSVEEIARLYSIPLPMLQTGPTAPATLTPYLSAFARMTLAPIVAVVEAEFLDLLPAGQSLRIDMASFLRGDYSAIAASQAVLVQSRIATSNEAREALGLPYHPSGDDLQAGSPPSFPADASGMPSLAPKPGPGAGVPGVLPNVGTHQDAGSK
jgi:HK97 family phage portal protein